MAARERVRDALARPARADRRGRQATDGRIDAALRAPDPQPDQAPDRRAAGRPPRPAARRARDRAAHAPGSRRRGAQRGARPAEDAEPHARGLNAVDRALPLLRAEARDAARTVDGYVDLLGPETHESPGMVQNFMLSSVVPQVYERWWRPALGRMAKGAFGPGMNEEKRIARLLLALSPGDGVLDVGCGTGNFTRDFAKSVGPDGLVVGLDVSQTMLRRAVDDTAEAGFEQVGYVRGDAADLPFLNASFDAVCCFAALNLFADPYAALDSFTRVLTPGGRLAIFTSVRGRPLPLRSFERVVQAQSGMNMFERDELMEALQDRGFTRIRQRVTGMTQFVGGRLA